MKLIIKKSKKEVAKETAHLIANSINKNPRLHLGLATGKTMIPLYKELVKMYKKREINFKNIIIFNLDEYYQITKKDKKSLRYFIEKNLFRHINIKKKNINFLNGNNKNFKEECLSYEDKIKKLKINLLILGIGLNGHIAFNEPESSFNSITRKVKLTSITRKTNFKKLKKAPKYALTIGIKTILNSKKIILIATGINKRNIIKKVLFGKINKKIPASFLKKHKNVIIILDRYSNSK